MFNVKFCSIYSDGSKSTVGISCPHYSIYERKNGTFEIVTYKSMSDVDGVSRNIMNEDQGVDLGINYYQSCYIENAQGKTVEALRCKTITTGFDVNVRPENQGDTIKTEK